MAKLSKQEEQLHWDEIDSVVGAHKQQLKKATSHQELKGFAAAQGWMNEVDFPKFKVVLKKIGVDYDRLRQEFFDQEEKLNSAKLAELGPDAPEVWLWSGAVELDKGVGRFAIVNVEKEVVTYGGFFDDDQIRVKGDLITAEQSAASKAVWVAHKALEAAGYDSGRLHLSTTCPDLDVEQIKADGIRLSIDVHITVSDDMRAVEMAELPGYQKYTQFDLPTLVTIDGEPVDQER